MCFEGWTESQVQRFGTWFSWSARSRSGHAWERPQGASIVATGHKKMSDTIPQCQHPSKLGFPKWNWILARKCNFWNQPSVTVATGSYGGGGTVATGSKGSGGLSRKLCSETNGCIVREQRLLLFWDGENVGCAAASPGINNGLQRAANPGQQIFPTTCHITPTSPAVATTWPPQWKMIFCTRQLFVVLLW